MDKELTNDISNGEETKKLSNARKAELRQEWVDEVVSGCRTEGDLLRSASAPQSNCVPRDSERTQNRHIVTFLRSAFPQR